MKTTFLTNKPYYLAFFYTFSILIFLMPYFNVRFLLGSVLIISLIILTLSSAGINNELIIFKFHEYMLTISTLVYLKIISFMLSDLAYNFDSNILSRFILNNVNNLIESSSVCIDFVSTQPLTLYDILYCTTILKLSKNKWE